MGMMQLWMSFGNILLILLLLARGETPLNSALKSNDMKVISFLKEKGAREGSPVTEEAWKSEYAHYVKGNDTFVASNFQEAQGELDAALQINPYHANPYA